VVKKSQKLYPPSLKASSFANHRRQKHFGGQESASRDRLRRAGRFFTGFQFGHKKKSFRKFNKVEFQGFFKGL
jgi:hypothetical protein